jgi:hypothetical protein
MSAMSAQQIEAIDPTVLTEHKDCRGQIEFRLPNGTVVGLAAYWPDNHSRGRWLAQWSPRHWRDCGMKRFNTVRGARTRILKMLATPPPQDWHRC